MANSKWTLKADRFEHKAGTVVYAYRGHDYGLSRDDGRASGLEHVSVSLLPPSSDPLGQIPFFTVPCDHLEQITEASA
jgi:hypothetical protein